jgi:hypothetical protein
MKSPTIEQVSPVVVVSTHLDDAVLSCYSALGSKPTVVTVLAGVPPLGVLGGWDADGGATDSHDRVLERRDEDRRALLLSGSGHVHMDFPDAQQWGQADIIPPKTEELADGLRVHLERAGSVYAPAGIWNAEHKLVRDAVLRVRADASLYADLPYALHPQMGGFELPEEVPAANRRRREEQLNARTAAAKVESARCYETQLRQLVAIFGPFLNAQTLSREVFWDWIE